MKIVSNIKDIIRKIIGEVPTKTLIKRGLKVGNNFNRQQGCFIDPTHCFLIEIGNNVTFSIRVTLLAHDASTKIVTGYTKIGKIKIGNNVFIGANSTVLPNINIDDNVVVGANSVITKDIPSNCVVAGNPARVICSLNEFKLRNKLNMENTLVFDKEYRFSKNMDDNKKMELIKAVENNIAFID